MWEKIKSSVVRGTIMWERLISSVVRGTIMWERLISSVVRGDYYVGEVNIICYKRGILCGRG